MRTGWPTVPGAGAEVRFSGTRKSLAIERVPTQQTTDLRHLVALAERNGYVAYVIPGPVPGASTFYWGPPVRVGLPQPALSVDLGAQTNVTSAPQFRTDALSPVQVTGEVMDPFWEIASVLEHSPASWTPERVARSERRLAAAVAAYG